MTKKVTIIAVAMVTLAILVGIAKFYTPIQQQQNIGVVSGVIAIQTSSATTSPNFLVGAGRSTTTLQFSSDAIEEATMFIQYKASTTAGSLAYRLQFTNNGIDWFDDNTDNIEKYVAFNNIVANATSTLEYTWTPGVISTTTKIVQLRIKPSKAARVLLYAFPTSTPATGSVGNVWAEIYVKKTQ